MMSWALSHCRNSSLLCGPTRNISLIYVPLTLGNLPFKYINPLFSIYIPFTNFFINLSLICKGDWFSQNQQGEDWYYYVQESRIVSSINIFRNYIFYLECPNHRVKLGINQVHSNIKMPWHLSHHKYSINDPHTLLFAMRQRNIRTHYFHCRLKRLLRLLMNQ